MKINTFSKLVIVTVLIAVSMCSKLNRVKSEAKDGSGSWKDGFLCPKIFLTAKGQAAVDQGAGKFFPAKFVDGKDATAEDKLGLVIEFTNAPKDLIKTKVGVKIDDKKYYIPFRFFPTVQLNYVNPPVLSNKYFLGTLTNDDGESFEIKIVLPWSFTSWYISDKEAHLIRGKIESLATSQRSEIDTITQNLSTEFSKLRDNKGYLETAQNDFASLAKKIEDNKKDIENKKKTAESLDKQIQEFNKQISELQEKISVLQGKKDALNSDYRIITESIMQTESSIQEKSGKESSQKESVDKYTTLVKNSQTSIDLNIGSLTLLAPEKTIVIGAIKTSITNLKQDDLNLNMAKIRHS